MSTTSSTRSTLPTRQPPCPTCWALAQGNYNQDNHLQQLLWVHSVPTTRRYQRRLAWVLNAIFNSPCDSISNSNLLRYMTLCAGDLADRRPGFFRRGKTGSVILDEAMQIKLIILRVRESVG